MSEIELPQRSSLVRLVSPDNDDMSEIELLPRFSDVRLVNPLNDDMSEIELFTRSSLVRLVSPDNDDMSEIELPPRFSLVRLVACSSPVKSMMLELFTARWVNASISDVVMVSPDALRNLPSITARRLESGMFTTTPGTISSNSTVAPLL